MGFFDLLYLFLAGSGIGWVLELFYRRIFSAGKWINPGFLSGPWVPLYGFGLVCLYQVTEWLNRLPIAKDWLRTTVGILLCGICMTLLELIAGMIFIEGMKIKLWDYSDRWGNYKGIVCPLFGLIWTGVAAGYRLLLHPLVLDFLAWNDHSVSAIFVQGVLLGLLLSDFGFSMHLATRIRKIAKESHTVIVYERLKQTISAELKEFRQKRSFLFPLRSSRDIRESIGKYLKNR